LASVCERSRLALDGAFFASNVARSILDRTSYSTFKSVGAWWGTYHALCAVERFIIEKKSNVHCCTDCCVTAVNCILNKIRTKKGPNTMYE
jgi:hypothetical protein